MGRAEKKRWLSGGDCIEVRLVDRKLPTSCDWAAFLRCKTGDLLGTFRQLRFHCLAARLGTRRVISFVLTIDIFCGCHMFSAQAVGLRPQVAALAASFVARAAKMHDCPRSAWAALEPRTVFPAERVLIAARDALQRRLAGESLNNAEHRIVCEAASLLRLGRTGADLRAAVRDSAGNWCAKKP